MGTLMFEYIKRNPNYNEVTNPEQKNVFELSPIGFQWQHDNQIYKYMFKSTGFCCPLISGEGFAIVDTDKTQTGKAFLLNIKGDIVFEIKRKDDLYHRDNYTYVFYENNELCFIVNNSNIDYKHVIDVPTKITKSVDYVRW
ncbi:hypothetical protein [Bartonella sp. HY406]|uniref:hypothetical protein n=1 Tax=Bartonella sp. HY406 TaxID=2979331 RepID=UPI0021C8B2B2|nr:hypothetical protein [Bartonella sp. HY406]UXN04934.1 hypothetical protein N6B01_14615 [Bartonella sp. HY406]